MGVVYEAEDLRLHRHAALKFVSDDLISSASALLRFEREAQAASALNHPGICTIHDIETADGQTFIVMELLKGRSLKDMIRGRPLETGLLLDIAIQIADALNTAHAAGFIHRDLKPEISLSLNPARPRCWTLDWQKCVPRPWPPAIYLRL
jgi:eukaryotic-like serine/threonine-protein kinase